MEPSDELLRPSVHPYIIFQKDVSFLEAAYSSL
jgi:hypothetical protein